MQYLDAHLGAWPDELRATRDPEDPLWTVARHLDLGWQGPWPHTLASLEHSALAPQLTHWTVTGHEDLNLMRAMSPVPHLESLTVTGDDSELCLGETIANLPTAVPNLSRLTLTNCIAESELWLEGFARLRRLSIFGVVSDSQQPVWSVPPNLAALEIRAWLDAQFRLAELLDTLEAPGCKALTLGWMELEQSVLDAACEREGLNVLNLLNCDLPTAAPATEVSAVAVRRQTAPIWVSHGVYRGTFYGGPGGEAFDLELAPGPTGCQFEYSWGGWWADGYSADSDNYEASGVCVPVAPEVTLLAVSAEDGHLSDMTDCAWPYLVPRAHGLVLGHPGDRAGTYTGPFNVHLEGPDAGKDTGG